MDAVTLAKLFVAFIWGLVVGFLAKRKNRSPWGWGGSWCAVMDYRTSYTRLHALQMPQVQTINH